MLKGLGDDRAGNRNSQIERKQQPSATNLAKTVTRRYPLQFAFQIRPELGDRFQEARLGNALQDGNSRRAHKRVAVERSTLIAVFEAGCSLRRQQRGQRNAAADPLSKCHDVRLYPDVFVMEKLPGPAHASLDLIQDQQEAPFLGQLAQIAEELIGCRPYPGFTLDWLEHYGNRLFIDQSFDGGEIVKPSFRKARHFG